MRHTSPAVAPRPVRSPEPRGQSARRAARCPPWPRSDSNTLLLGPGLGLFLRKRLTGTYARLLPPCDPAPVGKAAPPPAGRAVTPSRPLGPRRPLLLSPFRPPTFPSTVDAAPRPRPLQGASPRAGPGRRDRSGLVARQAVRAAGSAEGRRPVTHGDTARGRLAQRRRGLRVLVSVARVPCAETATPGTVRPQSSGPRAALSPPLWGRGSPGPGARAALAERGGWTGSLWSRRFPSTVRATRQLPGTPGSCQER